MEANWRRVEENLRRALDRLHEEEEERRRVVVARWKEMVARAVVTTTTPLPARARRSATLRCFANEPIVGSIVGHIGESMFYEHIVGSIGESMLCTPQR